MTTRKRPATDELTSCSVPVLEPARSSLPVTDAMDVDDAPSCFTTVKTAVIRAASWLLGGFRQNPDPPVFDLRYGSAEVLTDAYRQTSETRSDDTTHQTLKRQRIRGDTTIMSPSSRSRSADQSLYKSGRGSANLKTSHNTDPARQQVDDRWRPPVHHALLKTPNALRHNVFPTPPLTLGHEPQTPFRRHSDSSEVPLDQESLTPSAKSPDLSRSTTLKSPNLPRSTPLVLKSKSHNQLNLSKTRAPNSTNQPELNNSNTFESHAEGSANKSDLNNRLNDLLLGPEDPKLATSTSKKAVLADRQRQRELKRAEELRQEEKRKAEELKRLEKERLEKEAQARLRRRLPNKPLVGPLNRKWEEQVDNSYLPNNSAKIITTSIGGTELAVKDFKTLLNRHSWLNDEIINSYIEWVVDAANKASPPNAPDGKEKPVPKFIAHNSFFYENLTKKGPTSTDRLMKRKAAGGKSLLQVDTVFVPICRGSHWTIGAVRPFAKTIEYFDSFGGHNTEFINQMRGWLRHQLGDAYIASEWKEPRTGCAAQSNGWDCGVFVCTNAFCVAFGLETSCYRERDMEQQRRRIAALLINRGFQGEFAWEATGL